MFSNNFALVSALAGTSMAGTLLWDGRFNDYTSSTELDNWSWSNQVGEYQWYIHGDGNTTDYVNLSSDFGNPADTSSKQGAKLTIDSTSSWEGQTMLRTELIPQTSAAIGSGKKYYHFSIKHANTNIPDSSYEHQVAFFESHFTELQLGSADSNLHWYADSTSQWNTTFDAGVWHNIAYGIDFDAGTVEFYHSTGADDLTLTAGPVDVTASSNGADWHVGVLRLASTTGEANTGAEDWYFSGVYVEEGDVTTSVVGPSNGTESDASTSAASTVAAASSTAAATSSTAVVASSIAASSVASVSTQAAVVSSSSSVASVSTQAAVVSSSSAVVSSSAAVSATTIPSSSSAIASSTPTTLQTLISSSSTISSAVSSSAVNSAVSSAITSAPATTAAATTYACNPAHSYPNSQSCISTNGSLTLVSPATAVASSPSVASSVSSAVSAEATGDAEAQCVVEYVYV